MRTSAVTPEPGVADSMTWIPCRAASRATTWKPNRCETEKSSSGGSASRALVAANTSGAMPMPQSSTVSSHAPASRRSGRVRTVTDVSGGENRTAFSVSSASRWVRSVTACPMIAVCSSTTITTRDRSSVSAIAARSTSRSGTGSLQVRGGCSPESTSRFSALRRTRVAMWSSRKSSASASGSSSDSSSWLMMSSCR